MLIFLDIVGVLINVQPLKCLIVHQLDVFQWLSGQPPTKEIVSPVLYAHYTCYYE